MITPLEAAVHNNALLETATKADEIYPHIDASYCSAHLQKAINEQLIAICQQQQQHIFSFTPLLNNLINTCGTL